MYKVSIIIPVYNSELFLKECLDSIVNQTYENLEIICIDDCSTDNSNKILLDYAKNDNRFIILKNDENIGQGLSRRYGIKKSSGDYIITIDSDDYVDKDFIEKLINVAIDKDCDIVSGNLKIFGLYTYDFEPKVRFYDIIFGIDEMKKNITYEPIITLNNKLIKKTIYDKVLYSDKRMYEDVETLNSILYKTKTLFYIKDTFYYYRQHENNSSKTRRNL